MIQKALFVSYINMWNQLTCGGGILWNQLTAEEQYINDIETFTRHLKRKLLEIEKALHGTTGSWTPSIKPNLITQT